MQRREYFGLVFSVSLSRVHRKYLSGLSDLSDRALEVAKILGKKANTINFPVLIFSSSPCRERA
jgi:hypothetical protein